MNEWKKLPKSEKGLARRKLTGNNEIDGQTVTVEKNIKKWRSKHGNLLIFKIYDSCEVKTTFVKNELRG